MSLNYISKYIYLFIFVFMKSIVYLINEKYQKNIQ